MHLNETFSLEILNHYKTQIDFIKSKVQPFTSFTPYPQCYSVFYVFLLAKCTFIYPIGTTNYSTTFLRKS